VGCSLVGLIGTSHLRDENRLDRFVPPQPEFDAAEQRFRQAFGSDLYLPISVRLNHPVDEKQKQQNAAFFQAISALPIVERAITPFSVLGGLLAFSFENQLSLQKADLTAYSALFVLNANQQQHDLLLDTIESLARQHLSGSPFEVAVGGEPEVNGWLTREAKKIKEKILPLAALAGVCMLLIRMPTLRLRAIVGAVVVLALGNALLPLVLSGQAMHLLLLLTPLLAAVIALAGSIHIVTSHRAHLENRDLANQFRKEKIQATFFCFLTTALGFGSLATSPIPAIRDLGLMTGSGVFLAGLTVLILLPQFLDWWVPRGGLELSFMAKPAPARIWGWIGVLTLIVSCYFFSHLESEIRATHYFNPSHPVQRSLRQLEQDFLPIRSYEVLIAGASKTLANTPLDDALSAITGVEHVFSDEMPGFPMFAEEGRLRRVTVFVSDAALANPLLLQNDIRLAIRTAMKTPVQVFLVGILSRIVSAQHAIQSTLKRSLLITGLALTTLFAFLTRSVPGAVAAVIANAFPLAGIVILQFLLAWPLDLGIVLTYSICLGLAVDDTLHLVFDMKRLGKVSLESIRNALVCCGPGMYESSWILAAGFAFLTFSDFLPVRHFGVLATAGVLLALVGDLLIFPSIIARFSSASSEV